MAANRIEVNDVPGVFRLLAETFSPQPPADVRNEETPFTRAFTDANRELAKSTAYSLLGFVGASIIAIGFSYPVAGFGSLLTAFATLLIGGGIATYGWVTAWRILDRIDGPDAPMPSRIVPPI